MKVNDNGVGVSDRNDYFKFTLASPLSVYVKLYNMTDNADLMLLNSAGTRIGYSKNTGSAADGLMLNLSAGTYYVRVLYTGSLGTTYRLRVEGINPAPAAIKPTSPLTTAKDAGSLSAGVVRAIDDFVGPSNTADYFRVTVTSACTAYIKLSNLTDNADLQLLDSSGNVVASSCAREPAMSRSR